MKTEKPPDETNKTTAPASEQAPPAAPPAAAPPAPAPAPKPAAAAPPAAPPAAAPPAARGRTIDDVIADDKTPAAVKRDRRAARKALRAAGIDVGKKDDIDEAIARHNAKQEKVKTERGEFSAKAELFDAAEASAVETVDYELSLLSEEQRAQAKIFLGDGTAVSKLGKLTQLKKSGMLRTTQGAAPLAPAAAPPAGAPPPAPPAAPAAKPTVEPPARTAPTATAPAAGSGAAPDVKTEIKRLESVAEGHARAGTGYTPEAKRSRLLAVVGKFENRRALYKDDNRPQ